jgi:hypothetical protein
MRAFPALFYNEKPTGRGDAGAGALDYAFQYPWLKPALAVVGAGIGNRAAIRTTFKPLPYAQRVTNAAVQAGGNLAGSLDQLKLMLNPYTPQNNNAVL